jgi:hypothetical protein
MLWLTHDCNRNIVTGLVVTHRHAFSHACTGAAGSVTTGGSRFAGKAKVVPKTQGFAMLAAHVNQNHPGSGWTADIASKKYLYLQGKYSAAKTASYRSDWGLSQVELTKGVTMAGKLEGMCKDFGAWDKWFGNTQKYNPSNVQDSSAAVTGGASTATPREELDELNDGGEVEREDASSSHTDEDEAIGNDVDDDEEGEIRRSADLHDNDSVDRATAFMGVIPAHVPAMAAPLSPPTLPAIAAAPPAPKPATQAQQRRDKAKAKAEELLATKEKIMEAITANSSTSVNNSPRGTFDATYVATSQAKIEGLIKVETMRSTSQQAIACDELRLSTMKLQFRIESAESDRASRGEIQSEINITSLLNTDPTGATARLMISLVAERAAATAAAVRMPAPLSHNVAAFQLSLTLPAAVPAGVLAPVAVAVANRVPHVTPPEVIVLNSISSSAHRNV